MLQSFCFKAMNSPCEIHVDGIDVNDMESLGRIAEREAHRIESTYSRYRKDSILSQVNASHGSPVLVDSEMLALLAYAQQCYQLSDGLFDITSGVLRRVWQFDGSDNLPAEADVASCLPFIGFELIDIDFEKALVSVPQGVEIDFGGIGKEYAVDRTLKILQQVTDHPILVNFGGDLAVSGPRIDGSAWRVAIDDVNEAGGACGALELAHGAITTSGDAARFLIKNGVRYSHILNPKTGWPIASAPRSVTVAAPNCMSAGMMSTMAMLMGESAEKFIQNEELQAWVSR